MSSDIRVATSFKGHRKRRKANLILGLKPSVTDFLLDLWIATAENHPDGILSGMDETDIALEAGWDGDPVVFVNALQKAGFLDNNNDGYRIHDWQEHQPWVVHSRERSERAKKAAEARWNLKPDAERMPQACGEHAESNAPSPTPIPTPNPIPNPRQESSKEDLSAKVRTDSCPHKEILLLYHQILPELPKAKEWPAHLQKILRSRWKESSERQNLEWWKQYFLFVRESGFLLGRSNDFRADLEWIIRPGNMTKILNGRYHKDSSRGNARFLGIKEWLTKKEAQTNEQP